MLSIRSQPIFYQDFILLNFLHYSFSPYEVIELVNREIWSECINKYIPTSAHYHFFSISTHFPPWSHPANFAFLYFKTLWQRYSLSNSPFEGSNKEALYVRNLSSELLMACFFSQYRWDYKIRNRANRMPSTNCWINMAWLMGRRGNGSRHVRFLLELKIKSFWRCSVARFGSSWA